ncbi:phosphoenolpyruvate--protein phosphotransferase [Myxococcota bacterium]|nr:phosphoenolpyruvate--protein phosphotransferase [Myxococcota bacterium]
MTRSRTIRGIGASPGVAIGRVFLLDRRRVHIPRFHIQPDQIEYEQKRLREAIEKSIAQLDEIRSRFVGDGQDHQAILQAHEMMLGDAALYDEAAELIRTQKINAGWAVSRVIARLRALFEKISDTYLKERQGDIDFVGERIMRNLAGQPTDLTQMNTFSQLGDGTIVVAHDLSPVDTAILTRQRITAIVTEVGGKTSHTSIVARSMEIPAVVGTPEITDTLGSGDLIIVDGFDGTVVVKPSNRQIERARERSEKYRRAYLELLEAKSLPARTLDDVEITIAGNIELPSEVSTVLNRGGTAIGLFRTEFMYIDADVAPDEESHYRTYCNIFDEIGDREVTIRTLDLGGDKNFDPKHNKIIEPNPALGLRAIRYCLLNQTIFEAQIAGLLRAATRGNLRIMLPMISGIDELHSAKAIFHKVRQRLEREGKEHKADVPVGIMIEVPSAVFTADILAEEADFFAIGTNDLLQYLLAVDRTNERVDYLYNPLHPAVLRAIRMVTAAAAAQDISVSVCGEMAGDPFHAPVLLGLGISQLSMNAGSIPRVKRLIRDLRFDDCVALVENLENVRRPIEATSQVRAFLRANAPDLDLG